MSTREIAYKIINNMSDEEIMKEFGKRIADYIGLEDIPSLETIEAFAELDYMEQHPEEYKSYRNVDEMFKDVLGDDWRD